VKLHAEKYILYKAAVDGRRIIFYMQTTFRERRGRGIPMAFASSTKTSSRSMRYSTFFYAPSFYFIINKLENLSCLNGIWQSKKKLTCVFCPESYSC